MPAPTVIEPNPNGKQLERNDKGQVRAGAVLNPAGRPKGSRNKLGESFIADMHAAWEKNGVSVINRVIEEDPVAFLKAVGQIIPQKLEIDENTTVNITVTHVRESVSRKLDRVAATLPERILAEQPYAGRA